MMPTESLQITPLRAFADNYIWLLRRADKPSVVVVDPGDAQPVLDYCAREGCRLVAILITHHHRDHIGGIARLVRAYPGVPVHGPIGEAIAGLTGRVAEGDWIDLPEIDARFQVLDVPGHTAGHIAFLGHGALFCGDTLFAGGCGRVFDGTFEQLAASLARIAALPPDTRIYCAHEYTIENLGFAKWVEPENLDLLARETADWALVEHGEPTVPSRLDLELRTNPFLRWDAPAVRAAAECKAGRRLTSQCEVFETLRRWKDSEYD
ncbi:MAG: hydroxyacylglutathione hydrolase [Thiotrichales bacterium]